jgi:hypothetical protein
MDFNNTSKGFRNRRGREGVSQIERVSSGNRKEEGVQGDFQLWDTAIPFHDTYASSYSLFLGWVRIRIEAAVRFRVSV